MLYHAQNGRITIDHTTMDYIAFGSGARVLVMIPGLGDGLKTAKGMALPFAVMFREFAREYRVYVFSRKNSLPPTYTSRAMAQDLEQAMEKLGIQKASVLGVSQGGTIAQYLAIDYPEMVDRLALIVASMYRRQLGRRKVNLCSCRVAFTPRTSLYASFKCLAGAQIHLFRLSDINRRYLPGFQGGRMRRTETYAD